MTTADHDPFRPRNASRRTSLPRRKPAAKPAARAGRPARRTGVTPAPADLAPLDTSDVVSWIEDAPTVEEHAARVRRALAAERSRRDPRPLMLAAIERAGANPPTDDPAPTPDPDPDPVAGEDDTGDTGDDPEPEPEQEPEPVVPAISDVLELARQVPSHATKVVAWIRDGASDTDREMRARAALEIESERDKPRKVVHDQIVRVLGEDA